MFRVYTKYPAALHLLPESLAKETSFRLKMPHGRYQSRYAMLGQALDVAFKNRSFDNSPLSLLLVRYSTRCSFVTICLACEDETRIFHPYSISVGAKTRKNSPRFLEH